MTDCDCTNFPARLGNVTFGASVGIGVGTPTSPLCVAGTVGAASAGYAAFGGQRWRLQQASGDEANAGCLDYRGFDAASLSIVGAGATGPVLNRNVRVYGTLTVGYSAPTGAVAAFNGNVGIGTDSPAELLDVAGTIRYTTAVSGLAGLVDNDFHAIRSNGAGSQVFANYWGFPSQGWIFRDERNGVDRVIITSGGSVGIGTDAPAHPLDVQGDVNTSGNLLAGGHKIADSNGSYYA